MEAAGSSETLVPVHQTIRHILQKTVILIRCLNVNKVNGFGEQPLIFLSECKDECIKLESSTFCCTFLLTSSVCDVTVY